MTCVLGSDEREALLMSIVAKGGFKALGDNVVPNLCREEVLGRYGYLLIIPFVN